MCVERLLYRRITVSDVISCTVVVLYPKNKSHFESLFLVFFGSKSKVENATEIKVKTFEESTQKVMKSAILLLAIGWFFLWFSLQILQKWLIGLITGVIAFVPRYK